MKHSRKILNNEKDKIIIFLLKHDIKNQANQKVSIESFVTNMAFISLQNSKYC